MGRAVAEPLERLEDAARVGRAEALTGPPMRPYGEVVGGNAT